MNDYLIIRNFVPPKDIHEIKQYWIYQFHSKNLPRVTWSPMRGQQNTIGFSYDSFGAYYRSCDFLWNEPQHVLTRKWCMEANKKRFEITQFYEPDLMLTVSYYPPNWGYMAYHHDGQPDGKPIIHGLIMIQTVARGGLFIKKDGQMIDVERMLNPGDLFFYNAALEHGIETIGSGEGRMQMSPFPVRFSDPQDHPSIAEIPVSRFLKYKIQDKKERIKRYLKLKPGQR